jgi:SAM-dependent methyltransferase
MAHGDVIRREFARQAAGFGAKGLTLSSQEYLAWMVRNLPLQRDFRVLDVAAGTGHLSRAIAPYVQQVVALDMTPEMLEEGRKEAARGELANISFEQGDAAALPYGDDSFDMVVSRLAIHHFREPDIQIKEMVRVCKAGHVVGIIDLLSPSDGDLLEPYNRLERLRDPSHTVALTREQLAKAMEGAGLSISHADARDITVDFVRWVETTGTDQETRSAIRRELGREIAGNGRTGMRPFTEDDRLRFMQVWSVFISTKPPNMHLHKDRSSLRGL